MAYPTGVIAGSLAAIYGGKGNGLSSVDTKYYRDLETLSENRNKILNYLNNSFKAEINISEEIDIGCTTYILKFKDFNIGIRLDDRMIINAELSTSCRYAYDLVWRELDKIKMRYVKE